MMFMSTAVKQKPCCARIHGRIVGEEANVARLARIASRRAAQGLSTSSAQAAIENAKATVAETRARLVDHEAEHAGELA
jgi:hypothetical protein